MALHGDLYDVDVRGVGQHLDDPAAKREIGQGTSVMHEMPESSAQLRLDLLDGRLATLVVQLRAGLDARLVRGLLGSGDLRLDALASRVSRMLL